MCPKIKSMIFHKIGNGGNLDNWHSNDPLLQFYGFRAAYDSGLPLIRKVSAVIRNSGWVWPHARSEALLELQVLLCDISPGFEEDEIIWLPFRSKIFNVSTTWNQIRVHYPPVQWYSLVWFKGSIPKHNFLCWSTIHDRLATHDRLQKWLTNVPPDCLYCGLAESWDHYFFESSLPSFGS